MKSHIYKLLLPSALLLLASACLNAAPSPATENLEKQYLQAVQLLEQGGDQNLQEAIQKLREASEGGLPEATNRLGYCLEKGIGVPANASVAREYFKKAADTGFAKAQFNYGLFLLKGTGGDKDTANGLDYLEKASHQGFSEAQRILADLYYDGTTDIPKNSEKSFEHFMALAKTGDPEAQNYIATMYSYGIGTKLNRKEAVGWLFKAANQGHSKAQAALGEFYQYGTGGLPRDTVESIKFYILSAKQGDVLGEKGLEQMTSVATPEVLAEATNRAEEFEKQHQPPASRNP